MSETALRKAIKERLELMGCWVVVSAVQTKRGKNTLTTGEPGHPDLTIISFGLEWPGMGGYLEVKLPGGVISADQVRWHQRAADHGIRTAFVTSPSDAADWVKYWRMGGKTLGEL